VAFNRDENPAAASTVARTSKRNRFRNGLIESRIVIFFSLTVALLVCRSGFSMKPSDSPSWKLALVL
jgi:hypothetical protein